MSGIGRIYRRSWKKADGTLVESHFWTISFPYQGKTRREAVVADTESQAKAALKRKLEEIGRGAYSPHQDKVTLATLVDHLKAKYRDDNKRSLSTALDKLKPVLDFFGGVRSPQITVQKINNYKAFRLSQGLARASINGELRYLRRLFSVGQEDELINHAPIIDLLEGENKRDDYIEAGDFYARLGRIKNEDVRDLVEFLFVTGWRRRSGTQLERSDLDFEHETVKLRGAISKNKKPMLLSFAKFPQMRDIFLRRQAKLRLDCPYIFHHAGKQIKGFRADFKAAFGGTGLTVHGLCRSAAVALSRAGIHEVVASQWMNRTSPMYRQYRIVDTHDTEEAGDAFQKYLEAQSEKRRVKEIK